ncbi:MAG: nicotinate phosphoribosyltransferase [Acidobacteria bacterium]|nr:nicotinate phosphoribosyltransferase [Acidobacteriota bacterium]|tara:strand:- start:3808 stop:5133 length:1326 start_codon:yes stop_codon:yes gene_type:complete
MAAGYFEAGKVPRASFELFVRELPPSRGYLVAAGLVSAVNYLENLHYTQDQIEYLRSLPALEGIAPGFFDEYLARVRFTGDMWAVPEGTPIFATEPLIRVTAPLAEAQLVETALLSVILFQTSVASKARRIAEAAAGRAVIEFGGRRAHGPEAALYAARAALLGGCQATSNLEAGCRFGVPVSGTMAHSWVMAHPDELTAFRRYMDVYGRRSVLLVDTYDCKAAVRLIGEAGLRPDGVRLDSGDLAGLSRDVRGELDAWGLTETKVLVSGDLDEHRVAELVASGAPIDGFGVGTSLTTVADAPALSGVYKLVEIERDGRMVPLMKLSDGKRTLPGGKQVWRMNDLTQNAQDVVGLAGELGPKGALPLMRQVMRSGISLEPKRSIEDLREFCLKAVGSLPVAVRRHSDPEVYPVVLSDELEQLTWKVRQALYDNRGKGFPEE